MGENPEVIPSSKATTSETNLSTSTRPRPASTSTSAGGKYRLPPEFFTSLQKHDRKRRQVSNTSHVISAHVINDTTNINRNLDVHDLNSDFQHENFSSVHDAIYDNPLNVSTEFVILNTTTAEKADEILQTTEMFDINRSTSENLSEIEDVNNEDGEQVESQTDFQNPHITQNPLDKEDSLKISEQVESQTSFKNPQITQNPFELPNGSDETVSEKITTDLQEVEEVLSNPQPLVAQIDSEEDSDEPQTKLELKETQTSSSTVNSTSNPIIENNTKTSLTTKSYEETIQENITEKTLLKITENDEKKSDEVPEVIQHDYPVYSYGQDEVEIVKLDNGTKKKSPDSNQLNNDVRLEKETENKTTIIEESSEELQTFNISPIKSKTDELKDKMHDNVTNPPNTSPNYQFVEIPENKHSKRVFVNVTIATEPDAKNPASKPVYILSVSVPTDGDPSNLPINIGLPNMEAFQMSTINPSSTPATTLPPPKWGGECECSCPCLEEDTSKDEEITTTESYSTDLFNSTTESYGSTFSEWMDESSTFTTDLTETSSSGCPEYTTPLPPAPTILILEGRKVI